MHAMIGLPSGEDRVRWNPSATSPQPSTTASTSAPPSPRVGETFQHQRPGALGHHEPLAVLAERARRRRRRIVARGQRRQQGEPDQALGIDRRIGADHQRGVRLTSADRLHPKLDRRSARGAGRRGRHRRALRPEPFRQCLADRTEQEPPVIQARTSRSPATRNRSSYVTASFGAATQRPARNAASHSISTGGSARNSGPGKSPDPADPGLGHRFLDHQFGQTLRQGRGRRSPPPARNRRCRRSWCAARRSETARSAGCPETPPVSAPSCRLALPERVSTPMPVTTTIGRPRSIGIPLAVSRRLPQAARVTAAIDADARLAAPVTPRRHQRLPQRRRHRLFGRLQRREQRAMPHRSAANARLAGKDGSSECPSAVAVARTGSPSPARNALLPPASARRHPRPRKSRPPPPDRNAPPSPANCALHWRSPGPAPGGTGRCGSPRYAHTPRPRGPPHALGFRSPGSSRPNPAPARRPASCRAQTGRERRRALQPAHLVDAAAHPAAARYTNPPTSMMSPWPAAIRAQAIRTASAPLASSPMKVRDEPITPCTMEMLPASRFDKLRQEQGRPQVAQQMLVQIGTRDRRLRQTRTGSPHRPRSPARRRRPRRSCPSAPAAPRCP